MSKQKPGNLTFPYPLKAFITVKEDRNRGYRPFYYSFQVRLIPGNQTASMSEVTNAKTVISVTNPGKKEYRGQVDASTKFLILIVSMSIPVIMVFLGLTCLMVCRQIEYNKEMEDRVEKVESQNMQQGQDVRKMNKDLEVVTRRLERNHGPVGKVLRSEDS